MKEIDKGVLKETEIFKFGGVKVEQEKMKRELKRREKGENEDGGF